MIFYINRQFLLMSNISSIFFPQFCFKLIQSTIHDPGECKHSLEVNKILECLKRNNAPPFDKVTKVLILIFTHQWKKKYPRVRYARTFVRKHSGNVTLILILTEWHVPGSMFMRRLTFFVWKSIRKYFIGKSGAFRSYFCVFWRISNYNNSYQ